MKLEILETGYYYHIYNRGIDSQPIFKNDENKQYFLQLIEKYLSNKVDIFAFCLMDNHYHLAVRINCSQDLATKAFSNLFNAYAKAFNKRFNRTGSLFEKHFKRIRLKDESYLKNLIVYIHTNPSNHKIFEFENYPFSSYSKILNGEKSISPLKNNESLILFEDIENFKFVHQKVNAKAIEQQGLKDFLSLNNSDRQGSKNLAGLENTNTTEPTCKVSKSL